MDNLDQKKQEKVTGGKTIHMPSMEEQLARLVHTYKAKGMSLDQTAEELARKYELAVSTAKVTVEKYW